MRSDTRHQSGSYLMGFASLNPSYDSIYFVNSAKAPFQSSGGGLAW
jgi:hypothetical protein